MERIKKFDEFVTETLNESAIIDKVKDTLDVFTDNPKKYIKRFREEAKELAKEYKEKMSNRKNLIKNSKIDYKFEDVDDDALGEEIEKMNDGDKLKKIVKWIKEVVFKEYEEVSEKQREECKKKHVPYSEPECLYKTLDNIGYYFDEDSFGDDTMKNEIKKAFGIDQKEEPNKYSAVLCVASFLMSEIERVRENEKRKKKKHGGGGVKMNNACLFAACVR